MPRTPTRQPVAQQDPSLLRRIGPLAGFVVVPVGLVFGAFQVQGWTMPRLLAIVLITILLAAAFIALALIAWEVIKATRAWWERRETSTAWIADEPPGTLDYVPDMNRASTKFLHQMTRLGRDTTKLGRQMGRNARTIKWAMKLGPRPAQIWANHTARGILRSAVFIEKRSGSLRKTVDEFARAQEGHLTDMAAPQSDEDRTALRTLSGQFAEQIETTAGAIESVTSYREAVSDVSAQNFSRTLRVANHRLAAQLDAVIVVLRRAMRNSERLKALVDRKAAQ